MLIQVDTPRVKASQKETEEKAEKETSLQLLSNRIYEGMAKKNAIVLIDNTHSFEVRVRFIGRNIVGLLKLIKKIHPFSFIYIFRYVMHSYQFCG